MAERKKTAAPKTDVKVRAAESVFSKEKLLASDRFGDRKDLLNVVLSENKDYTIAEAEQLINKFMKGKVN